MRLTLTALEATGVYTHALCTWRDKAEVDRTFNNFQTHFTRDEKEHLRLVMVATARYHGAHVAHTPPILHIAVATLPPMPEPITGAATQFCVNNVNLFYCWTHGINHNPTHCSATCTHPAEGHQTAATLCSSYCCHVTTDVTGHNPVNAGIAQYCPRRRPYLVGITDSHQFLGHGDEPTTVTAVLFNIFDGCQGLTVHSKTS